MIIYNNCDRDKRSNFTVELCKQFGQIALPINITWHKSTELVNSEKWVTFNIHFFCFTLFFEYVKWRNWEKSND